MGSDYNWSVFKQYVVEGQLPNYKGKLNNQVLMSRLMASRLNLRTGDTFFSFFLKNNSVEQLPNQRKFIITGLYDSGFDEFDGLYLFTDIRHIQAHEWLECRSSGQF